MINKIKKQKGYTLLFAVLTATVVLGVAVFILSISRKQYILSATARESMYSFYAADSGIECFSYALFQGTISTSSPGSVSCNSNTITLSFSQISSYPTFNGAVWQSANNLVALNGRQCAKVTVTVGKSNSGNDKTVIESSGYNLCTVTGPDTSPRTVERALRLTYQ